MWRNWRMPCFRTCSACRRVSSQLNGEPCDSSPMPARGGAGKKKGRGERRTENGAGAEPARRGVRSAPRQRRREPSPAPHVTAAARQAVTQHFPATGPAPLEAGAPPRPPRSASARGEGEGPAVADSPQRPAGKSDYGGKWGSAGGV